MHVFTFGVRYGVLLLDQFQKTLEVNIGDMIYTQIYNGCVLLVLLVYNGGGKILAILFCG